ncbi:hypothetical protein EI94DRAFT_999273 [Lactarius quietus]|nr:hypothetical protein EI94DRAFT_999273 [Lactarius quietus]
MVIGTIRATVATAYPSAGAVAADNNLRIASLTLGAYDYLMTLPAEYRIYKSSNRRSNVGFFHHGFKSNTCEHYFMLSPVFKVIQMMASQAILAIRTYGISQRSPYVGWTLMVTYLLVAGFQWFTSMYARVPYSIDGNCTILSSHPKSPISTWSFYMVAMLFDCLTLSISTFYLMRVRAATSNSSRLLKILLYDGLGYFVVLTLTNMANILLYRGIGSVIQTTGASFEYAVTWIMSQRILIHPRDARTDQTSVILSEPPSSRAVMSALRFDKGPRDQSRIEPDLRSQDEFDNTENDFDLQVRIDRSIVVDGRAQEKAVGPKEQDPFWDQI